MYFISPDLGDIVRIGRRFYVYIASSKHEEGWENSRKLCKRILESYANEFSKVIQTRDAVEGLHNFREFSQPRECSD